MSTPVTNPVYNIVGEVGGSVRQLSGIVRGVSEDLQAAGILKQQQVPAATTPLVPGTGDIRNTGEQETVRTATNQKSLVYGGAIVAGIAVIAIVAVLLKR
jgi:hypothetical protein